MKKRRKSKVRRAKKPVKASRPKKKVQRNQQVDLELLREIMALMEKGNLNRFEYAQGALKINLERGNQVISGYLPAPKAVPVAPVIQVAEVAPPAPLIPAPAPPPASRAAPSPPPAAEPAASKPTDSDHDYVIVSPVVGSFYSAPGPGAEAFVKVGSHIAENTVVCIVEAMKLLNEIKAQVNGTITEILVENGDPVEFGHELFRVRLD